MKVGKLIRKALKYSRTLERTCENFEDRRHLRAWNRTSSDLSWHLGPRAPFAFVEGSSHQLKNKIYIFGGYRSLDVVSQETLSLDLETEIWQKQAPLPEAAANTHSGITSDGSEYIFLISGQRGGNCSPATPNCLAFHTPSNTWSELPPLPEGRYMPMVHFFNGRIHCLSGTKPDRHTPAFEHWSLGVANGKPTDKKWRTEANAPCPRTHTASHLIGSYLYILSGQIGDVAAISGSPDYICDFSSFLEDFTCECYRLNLNSGETIQLENSPISLGHTENGVLQIGNKIFLAGGTTTNRNTLSDAILSYDTSTGKWAKVGRLPHPMKTMTAYWKGWLYSIEGQRYLSATHLRPGKMVGSVWKTLFTDTL